jgi:hypothetical protein
LIGFLNEISMKKRFPQYCYGLQEGVILLIFNKLRLKLTGLCCAVAALGLLWCAPSAVLANPLLRCHVTYAGSTQVVEARPVADPYPVASVDIGGRFWFKAVMVGTARKVESIALYAYLDTPRQPVLIHQALHLPPYTASAKPYPLTGQQHLYAGPVERELIYHCTLQGVQP